MKTRKIRLLSALLALAMLLALLPTAAFAEDSTTIKYDCGENGNNVIATLDTVTGTLTISGSGKMADYNNSNGSPWSVNVKKAIQTVVIGKDVTSIGSCAFYNTTYLTSVTFENGSDLTNIGHAAFGMCGKLTSITIPSSVTTIGANAFTGCEGLTSITIPSSVTIIGANAFEWCSGLQSVTFAPNSGLQTIGNNAFGRCHKDLIFCYSDERGKQALLTKAGVSADIIKPAKPTVTFDSNNGSNVEPATVKNGDAISAPAAPTKEGYVFDGWYTDVALTQKYDFSKPVIDDMTLYAKWNVGGDCGDNLTWSLDSDGTLTISGTGAMKDYGYRSDLVPWDLMKNQIQNVVIGDGVTSIGDNAFGQCTNLGTVDLSNATSLEKIGSLAFFNCSQLKNVDLSEAAKLKEIGDNAFNSSGVENVTFPQNSQLTEIGSGVFAYCNNLKNIEIPETVTKIGGSAFEQTNLTSIKIPASVTDIGWFAFLHCGQLESVTFAPGSKLETIGKYAFSGCTALKTISCESALKEKLSGVVGEDIISVTHWNVKLVIDANTTTESVENNKPVKKPETDPAKDGYIFAGWYTKDANDKWADKPFDFSKAITDDTTLYARWGVEATPIGPATRLYPIAIDYGTAYDADHNVITKAAKGDIVTIEASETALEGMTFERWEVRKGDVKLENDRAAKTSFTMPAGEVQLEAMYQAAEVHDSGWDAATVVTGAVLGTGTAILAYHIGMEVYAEQVLGKDVAVPRTRSEVALLAWQLAGSPAVNVEGEPLSEAAQAEKWAVESGLMEPDAEGNFNGTKKMSKWNALRTLDAAKKMG